MSSSSCEYDKPVSKSIDEILANSFLMSVAVCKRFNNLKCVGISRNNSHDSQNFISWNWLSDATPQLESDEYDFIIFIPKPNTYDRDGYIDGFINSSKNVFNFCKEISFKKFITISSTRIYGEKGNKYFQEDFASPNEFRGEIILKYEKIQRERYAKKLIVLRLSGLYDSLTKEKPLNHLHRDNAAKIIKFFVQNDLKFSSSEVFKTSEFCLYVEKIKSIRLSSSSIC